MLTNNNCVILFESDIHYMQYVHTYVVPSKGMYVDTLASTTVLSEPLFITFNVGDDNQVLGCQEKIRAKLYNSSLSLQQRYIDCYNDDVYSYHFYDSLHSSQRRI